MKLRKIVVTILIFFIGVLITTNAYAAYPTWDSLTPALKQYVYDLRNFKAAGYGAESVGKTLMIGNTTLRFEDEIYCLSHKQTLEVTSYKVVKYLEINGEEASIPGSVAGIESYHNLLFARLLSRENTRYGSYNGAPYGSYSNTQKALWYYFKIWLDMDPDGTGPLPTHKQYFGFDSSYGDGHFNAWDNMDSTEKQIYTDGQNYLNKVETELKDAIANNTADQYKVRVRIYFLECGKANYQKVMIAVPESIPETSLVIEKIDGDTGKYLAGVVFAIQNIDTGEYITQTVLEDGSKNIFRATENSYTMDKDLAQGFVSSIYYTSLTIVGLKPRQLCYN